MNIMNMQQQIVEQKNTAERKKDRREGKGRVLAISRRVYRIQNTDTFYYVESETSDDHYYFVKFKPDVLEPCSCSCKDNSTRHLKCKHIFAIEFVIKWGTIKNTDKTPTATAAEADVKLNTAAITKQQKPKSYIDDDYSF